MRRLLTIGLLLYSSLAMLSSAQLNQGFIQSFGSSGFSEDSEYIAMDAEGNIWMAGEFDATWTPPSGPGSRSFSTNGMRDIYIVKMDQNGQTLWCQALQNSYDSWMTGITVDSEDNVLITGAFRGTMDFNPSPTEEFRIGAGTSNWHGFILKLDTNGDFLWATKFGTTGNSWHVYARDIIVDKEDNVIIAGTFSNPMKFGSVELSSVGPSTFVIMANKNGSAIWGTKVKDRSVDSRGRVLSLSPDNWIYLATNTLVYRLNSSNGNLEGGVGGNDYSTTIDTDETGFFTLKLRERTETFVGKSSITRYQLPWNYSWANDYDQAIFYEFRVTPYGLFAYGVIDIGVNVMPSNQEAFIYEGPSIRAGLIQKIDPFTGNVIKNTFFPTDNTMGFFGMAYNDEKVVMCGTYHGATCLNIDDPTDKPNGGNFGTSFIMDWTDCLAQTNNTTQWSCKPIVINNRTIKESGRYYSTSTNEDGCFTSIAIDLELELFDKVVLSDGEQLFLIDQAYDIQWYDCQREEIIPNATAYQFTPQDDRRYGAILENQGCKDTSSCFSINDLSFDADDLPTDAGFGSQISVSDNWAAISTKNSDKSTSGYVYLFKKESNKWVQKVKISPSERSGWDYFGDALSLNGDWLAIGAWNDDTQGNDAGKVYLYHRQEDNWVFDQAVFGDDLDRNDRFGNSVAITENLLIVGAVGKNSNNNNSIQSKEGAAYVFNLIGHTAIADWEQIQKLTHTPPQAAANFGRKVRIEDNTVFVSAPYASNNQNSDVGSILQYTIQPNNTLNLVNRLSYPNDPGIGVDFDVSGDKLIAATNNFITFFKKEGGIWRFIEELTPASGISDQAVVSIYGDYAAYKEATLRFYQKDVSMLHYKGNEWKPYRNFENGGHIDTHIYAFDMEDDNLLMGATENSQTTERGGRVFTHYYRFGLTPVNNLSLNTIEVYPSPTKDLLQIDHDKEIKTIQIYDLTGRSWAFDSSQTLDVSFLPEGVYILILEDQDKNIFKGKFVKI